MSVTAVEHPLLQEPARETAAAIPDGLAEELAALAFATDDTPARSQALYQQLRKMVGQPRLGTCLLGIQDLARAGEPAGARLLAALVDANTPGSVLLPRIQRFGSARRVLAAVLCDEKPPVHLGDWRKRLEAATDHARREFPGLEESVASVAPRPGDEPPFALMRATLRQLVQTCTREGTLALDGASLLAELVRLEVDAYQERVSALAGNIDPYRVSAVKRVLPLLSRSDAEIRDLRQLVAWIEEGDFDAAFQRRVPRLHDILDGRERERFIAAVKECDGLDRLASLLVGLLANPLPIRQLAAGIARLLAVGHQLVLAGERRDDIDLLAAVRLVQEYHGDDGLRIPLSDDLARTVGALLLAPQTGPGVASWSLDGLEVVHEALVLNTPDLGLSDHVWKHDLPTVVDTDPELDEVAAADEIDADEEIDAADVDLTLSAIKKMVMNNLGSTSIVLGFLRNPKITAIPGLVAAVARRTRTVRVIEVIASNRNLYLGHANKDVPLACLRSPCNAPVKTLRKFIHVKYVSKVDLKRTAQDKAGIRPEVVAEVKSYLKSLA